MDCLKFASRNSFRRLGTAALGLALLTAAPALAAGMAVKLEPGVFQAGDFTPPADRYVAASDSPIYTTLNVYGPHQGEVKMGEKLDVIAEAENHAWVLLGSKGVGIGYVPRSLVTPAKYAYQLKS